jgi:copper/silver efflux system protein
MEAVVINRVIDFSVENKFLIFAAVAVSCVAGWWSMTHVHLDAIPDLGDTQVIVYSRWDRSPDILEDQVTYPIVSALVGAPRVKAVRAISDFGYSYVYAIFEDGTDMYWARSRTLEYLSGVLPNLPQGVKAEIGPDATGLGWVYQYVLVDRSGQRGRAELRSLQDWYIRYQLKSVPGVAEVAPIGGFEQQYQVNVDPRRLQTYGLPISRVVEAVRGGNSEASGRLLEFGGTEYMVRGRGYAKSIVDFENIVVTVAANGTPVRVKDVGQVVLGPALRRGVVDLDGQGDAVSGIVVMRQGSNALQVIDAVKAKISEISPGLPNGVKLIPVYDRSELIRRSVSNLKSTIVQVLIIVSLVILIFLWHIPSAIIPLITIPVSILISFIPFRGLGITADIMSLGGIAIAIGALVDASIVVVEQTHKNLEGWERSDKKQDYNNVVLGAIKQVAGPSFFALLVIAVSFLPVLSLEAQEGRLFKPLAYTKTLAILVAAILAVTLDPALRMLFTRRKQFEFAPRWLCRLINGIAVGKIHAEENNVISRRLMQWYEPIVKWALANGALVIIAAVLLVIVTIPMYLRLGSEFMPPLDEGSLLYMPSTAPGISISQAQDLLQVTDRVIKQFPEVDRVLGKAGRAESATDPAPLSMIETIITLKPASQWRHVDRWYSSWAPSWLQPLFRRITPDHMTSEELIAKMNEASSVPGLANAWTMPVKGRLDMLTSGIRTPLGLKISGSDLRQLQAIGKQVESVLRRVKGTRAVFAERLSDGYFIDVNWNREALARYGVNLEDAQSLVENAIGGGTVSTTIEGPARYSVSVRYMPDFRNDLPALQRLAVPAKQGSVTLLQLADIHFGNGPAMLRNENGMLSSYVYVDLAGRDPGSYIAEAAPRLREEVKLPVAYAISWGGQYEAMERANQRLFLIIPVTAGLIILLLYCNTRSWAKTAIVICAVPFSAVGAIWLLFILGYNISVGVWVGLIALLGVDAETGVFMLLYLDLAYEHARQKDRLNSLAELRDAIVEGAARRLRPKLMTVSAAFLGLLPVMWSTGTGADLMKRIAAPMIGGIFTSFVLELLVYPPVYQFWRRSLEHRSQAATKLLLVQEDSLSEAPGTFQSSILSR